MKMSVFGEYILSAEEMAELVANVFGTRDKVIKEYLKLTNARRDFDKTMEDLRRRGNAVRD